MKETKILQGMIYNHFQINSYKLILYKKKVTKCPAALSNEPKKNYIYIYILTPQQTNPCKFYCLHIHSLHSSVIFGLPDEIYNVHQCKQAIDIKLAVHLANHPKLEHKLFCM